MLFVFTKILFTEYIERFFIFACISCFILKGFIIKPAYLCNTLDLLISHVRNKMSYVCIKTLVQISTYIWSYTWKKSKMDEIERHKHA